MFIDTESRNRLEVNPRDLLIAFPALEQHSRAVITIATDRSFLERETTRMFQLCQTRNFSALCLVLVSISKFKQFQSFVYVYILKKNIRNVAAKKTVYRKTDKQKSICFWFLFWVPLLIVRLSFTSIFQFQYSFFISVLYQRLTPLSSNIVTFRFLSCILFYICTIPFVFVLILRATVRLLNCQPSSSAKFCCRLICLIRDQ